MTDLSPGLLRLIKGLLLFESVLYSAVTPILPRYAHELHASKSAIGVLAAAYAAGLVPGSLLAGWLAARVGVRRTTVAGLTAFAVATVAFGFAGSLFALDALRALQGVSCGLIWGGALTWVIAASPRERRGALLGAVMAAAIFGTLIGPLLGTVAVAAGTRLTFALVGAISLALAVRVLAYPEPPAAAPSTSTPLAKVLRNRGLMLGAGLMVLGAATIGAGNALIPLRMSHFGASSLAIGITFFLASGASTLIAPVSGRLSDRAGVTTPMTGGLIAGALLLVLLPLPQSALLLAVLAVLALGGPLTAWTIPAASLITHAAEEAGIALAVATMVFNLAYAVGETIGAPAAAGLAQVSSDAVPFFVLAGLMLLTLRPVLRRTRVAPAAQACEISAA
ncbi:MAG TPA: MFS transporter [Solirubrobacterales bacterium]